MFSMSFNEFSKDSHEKVYIICLKSISPLIMFSSLFDLSKDITFIIPQKRKCVIKFETSLLHLHENNSLFTSQNQTFNLSFLPFAFAVCRFSFSPENYIFFFVAGRCKQRPKKKMTGIIIGQVLSFSCEAQKPVLIAICYYSSPRHSSDPLSLLCD